ncbi:MAG: YfcE family phosphodiesterase, partial [Patescibacteria group bacterium]|nr:YfcE family phosphodiesterase [Patescibacteria group bacterium]
MKIVIISDTHDNLTNTEKALKWIKKQGINTLIHCGDLCAPTFLTQFLVKKFTGQIHLVYGNVGDKKMLEQRVVNFPSVNYCRESGSIKIDGKKIAFTHRPDKAKEMALTGKYDLVFYGHTHKPWEDKIKIKEKSISNVLQSKRKTKKIVRLVNPGTLAGMFYRASFALYDTKADRLELKILD